MSHPPRGKHCRGRANVHSPGLSLVLQELVQASRLGSKGVCTLWIASIRNSSEVENVPETGRNSRVECITVTYL